MTSPFDFSLSRRRLLTAMGAGTALATTFPAFGLAAPTKKIVVIGGGMAGATVAKYLRLWSNKAVEVTIVEPSTTYVSNIMSNLVVTGQYALALLNYNWNNLIKNHGIKLVKGSVSQVMANGSGWSVSVTGVAAPLLCDRVVVTTQPLADALSSMHSDIRIVPNMLSPEPWATCRWKAWDFITARQPSSPRPISRLRVTALLPKACRIWSRS